MSPRNAVVIIGTLSGLGVALFFFMSPGEAKRESPEESKLGKAVVVEKTLGQESGTSFGLEDVHRSLAVLRGRLDELEAKDSGVERAAKENGAPSMPMNEIEVFDRAQAARQAAISRTVEFDDLLRREARDTEWADRSEKNLQGILKRESFAGTKVESIECASTFCRVEGSHKDRDGRDAFLLLRREVRGSFMIQELEDGDDGHLRTVAYFVREGQTEHPVMGPKPVRPQER